MQRILHHPKAPIIIILLLALAVRLLGISSRPIWYDEAFSILFAEKGPAAMLEGTLAATSGGAAEEHPLGYYVVLWLWMRLFGESLIAVRLLSVFTGLGSVYLAYLIGRRLFTENLGQSAALFMALSPFQVHFSQEIRMYASLTLWLLLATAAYLRATTTEKPLPWWALFSLSAALAQYTHSLASLYLLSLAMIPLIRRDWRNLLSLVLSGLAALLLYLPWLVYLPEQLGKLQGGYWLERPEPYKLITLLLTFVTNVPLPSAWLVPGLLIALFVTTVALWQTLRTLVIDHAPTSHALWLMHLAFTPALISFLISQWQPIFLERTLLPSGAIFCIWLAWALFATKLPRPVMIFLCGALAAGAAAGIYQHTTNAGFPYAPYGPMQASLQDRIEPGDVIIHSSKLSLLPSLYYDRTLPEVFIGDPAGGTNDTLALATQKVLGIQSESDLESAAAGSQRIWFIIFRQSIEEYTSAGYPTHPHLAWLDQHWKRQSVENLGDLQVYLYTR